MEAWRNWPHGNRCAVSLISGCAITSFDSGMRRRNSRTRSAGQRQGAGRLSAAHFFSCFNSNGVTDKCLLKHVAITNRAIDCSADGAQSITDIAFDLGVSSSQASFTGFSRPMSAYHPVISTRLLTFNCPVFSMDVKKPEQTRGYAVLDKANPIVPLMAPHRVEEGG